MSNDDQLILTVLSRLNESQARLYVAKEAICRGYGGIQKMHELTGLSRQTILKGMSELRQQEPVDLTEEPRQPGGGRQDLEGANPFGTTHRARRASSSQRYRIRRPGGGRKLTEEKDPAIVPALERLLADEIAGDPMTEQKWIRSSLRVLSKKLRDEGHRASTATVARLLKDMDFSLKANKRKRICLPAWNRG
jgi:hypothetical protein